MSDLLDKLLEPHKQDEKQLEVIKTNEKRLIIEAPAGYGKTKTMISQIAYIIASKKLNNPKKILALTFSVNAAYKIKKDIITFSKEYDDEISMHTRIFATNYHGFCRRVLKLYGYLIDERLKHIDNFVLIDDSIETLKNYNINYNNAEFLSYFNDAVKKVNCVFIKKNLEQYNNKVKEYLLSKEVIPFNAILTLTIELFKKYNAIRTFYQQIYPIIIVDEFQDTNILSYSLLNLLVSNETMLYLYGDSLQRIYGFIGAIPKLIEKAQKDFYAKIIKLEKNYRFKDNKDMLLLDRNLRLMAINPKSQFEELANIKLYLTENQGKEAEYIAYLVKSLLDSDKKIAILTREKGNNIDKIIDVLDEKNLDYFYALFSDEDGSYKELHREILNIFLDGIRNMKHLKKQLIKNIRDVYNAKQFRNVDDKLKKAILELFEIFWNKAVFGEYNFLDKEEKIRLIKDTLENNALKQYLAYSEKRVVVTTVHGAKGLEWDCVILPDMEQYSFPNWKGMCGECKNRKGCEKDWQSEDIIPDEFSVFYVAVTRAKEKVYFTASGLGINSKGDQKERNISCFLRLPCLNLVIQKVIQEWCD